MSYVAKNEALGFLHSAMHARYTALYLQTHEEGRAVQELLAMCKERGVTSYRWSIASGLLMYKRNAADPAKSRWEPKSADMVSPIDILRHIQAAAHEARTERMLFVLSHFHDFLEDPLVRRLFYEVYNELKSTAATMIVISPVQKIPPELEKVVTLVELPLPSREEITERVTLLCKREKSDLLPDDTEKLINASLGLARHELDLILARSLVEFKVIDARSIALVAREKKAIVQRTGLMEFFETDATIADVGGMDNLKGWLKKRVRSFSPEAREFGLPAPKGVLMVGLPGCGKSLTAKATAALLNVPLLRLDMGALFGGIVGQSEANARRVIQTAETLAPCVLWLDEIEKGMSGMESSGASDGGTTARVFSTFLTWLAEKKSAVFAVATSNDVSKLPPELLRKGRFDEIFSVDLPDDADRQSIFAIHLAKRKRVPAVFDLAKLAAATDGFSGAEIEQLVVDAMFEAFDAGRDLLDEDMIHVSKVTVPLSKTMGEKINALRRWTKTRARPASSRQETTEVKPMVDLPEPDLFADEA